MLTVWLFPYSIIRVDLTVTLQNSDVSWTQAPVVNVAF